MNRKEKELRLWKDWKKHDNKEARNELLDSMKPVMYGQINKFRSSPIPDSALESKAKRLTLKAFDTYDPSKAQLNTHVTNHLKRLQRFVIDYQNVGKIPEHRALAISKFQNVKGNLTEELDREPTIYELADELDWDPKEVDRMQSEMRKDLNIKQKSQSDENPGGFYDFTISQPDELQKAIEFVYHDSDSEKKKIIEYVFSEDLKTSEIANKLGRSESYIRKKMKEIARDIDDVR